MPVPTLRVRGASSRPGPDHPAQVRTRARTGRLAARVARLDGAWRRRIQRRRAALVRLLSRTGPARTRLRAALGADRAMTTAEYAVGTIAAVAFATLLYKIATSPQMVADMANLFSSAYHALGPSLVNGGN